jgi:NNP family nitrate/nitrite transporter-like MFS transporter
MLRPLGGYLADRFGGIRMLSALYIGVGMVMIGMFALPPLYVATALLFVGMGLLGMGNGSVFQLVPQRFPKEIGVITGIVGAAGGVGGFFLPTLLGKLKEESGSFAGGFLAFALVGFSSAVILVYVSRSWQATFVGRGGLAMATGEAQA